MKSFRTALLAIVVALVLFPRLDARSESALVPAADSGKIGLLVGRILSREHFRQQPLNDAVSRQFLDLYLNALDYNHLMFLQSDVDEMKKKYATTLCDAILQANVHPGFDIFALYLERVERRAALAKELLKENFKFEIDDRFLTDRSAAPWPASEEEARVLWRQRVKFELLQERLNNRKMSEAEEIVRRRYDRLIRSIREKDSDSVMQVYLTSLARVYDPHSDYLPPREYDNFAIAMKLSLEGIGAVLSSEDGYAKVLAIVPGGPADLDRRLKANDRIAGVAQGNEPMVDTVDMELSKVVEMIRGKKQTQVRLLVIPAAAADLSTRTEIRLVRDKIKTTEAEAKAKVIEWPAGGGQTLRLGYIDLPAFYANIEPTSSEQKRASQDMRTLITKLKTQGVEGLVLDLRKNGGGALAEVVNMVGCFIKSGPVVQVRNAEGDIKVLGDEDLSVLCDLPLVVMVTHISASASEIFAAAIQDYGRGVIVGDRSTFGKGTVQKIEELNRYLPPSPDGKPVGGALKFTVQKFYRISGGSTQYRGVIPDIQWPSPLDWLKINEADLKNPLPYDEIPPASYAPVNCVGAFLPELKARSAHRLIRDPEFAYIREDIARLKKQLEEKTVLLNEKVRMQERKENLARLEKRKQERKLRKPNACRETEIPLVDADGQTKKVAALTQQVSEQALANLQHSLGEEPLPEDSKVDPEYEEGLNILADLVELSSKTPKPGTP